MATQTMVCPKCNSTNIQRLGFKQYGRWQCECGFSAQYRDEFAWKVDGHLVYDDAQAAADYRDWQDQRLAASRGVL